MNTVTGKGTGAGKDTATKYTAPPQSTPKKK
jgi:hypothetical protein